ncbi:c(7)-type cytochrome triheme domain-containing protein [endosymbiont of Lamellibrachia barhami]|uniref:c(7)-type cytochrome triheme domain-containing protein n=1 Tax=endosymbiont of Lamellibrachia barhami TaxID=205975 RepID=UPI0015ADC055|nr:c(7)-type cytochrome triheme domain-containing protein [endosymbiont of Lamellibrachia barhami]
MRTNNLISVYLFLLAISSTLGAAPGDIQYERKGGDAEELKTFPPSIFPHWIHRINYRCDACHNKLFEMKTGTTPINKDLMKEGKVCAVCHNGKQAFDDGFENCNRCHINDEK